MYKYGLGNILIEYVGDGHIDERTILKGISVKYSYIAKFLRIRHGVFLNINENSSSVIIGNCYKRYPSSDWGTYTIQ